jgi:hypothetical protein
MDVDMLFLKMVMVFVGDDVWDCHLFRELTLATVFLKHPYGFPKICEAFC